MPETTLFKDKGIYMKSIIFIFVGGGLGATTRYLCSKYINETTGAIFPWGTFAVNIAGALAIGFISEIFRHSLISPEIRVFLITGYLGALTTFSTLSLESVSLMRTGEIKLFALNIIVTNIVGVAATIMGIYMSRIIKGV